MWNSNRFRFWLVFLLLQVGMVSCDWGTSHLQPDKSDDPGANIAFTPPDSNRLRRHRLENGMALLLLPQRSFAASGVGKGRVAQSQFIRGVLRLDVGWRHDPKNQPGLCFVTANAMMASLPGVFPELELGVPQGSNPSEMEFQVIVNGNSTDIYFRSKSIALASTLALLRQALSDPELSPEQIEQSRRQLMRVSEFEPGHIRTLRAARLAIPGFDVAHDAPLFAARPESILDSSVSRFSKEHFGSRGTILAIASPVRDPNIINLAGSVLGDWPHQPGLPPSKQGMRVAQEKTYFLQSASSLPEAANSNSSEVESALQAVKVIAFHAGLRWDHPDMPALMIAESILSDDSWSLRWIGGHKNPGRFQASSKLPVGRVAEELSEFDNKLAMAVEFLRQCSPDQFMEAKVQVSERLSKQGKAISDRLNRALDLEYHNYPRNFDETLLWAISRLEKEEVVQALERHLRQDRLQYFLSGPVDGLDAEFRGKVLVRRITSNGAASNANSRESAKDYSDGGKGRWDGVTAALSEPPDESHQDAAQYWVNKILDAHGGARPWQRAALFACQLDRRGPNEHSSSLAQVYLETPLKLRYAIAGMEQKIVVLQSERAWLQNGTNRRELTAGQLASWTELSMAFLPLLLMDLARGESVVTELDDGGKGVQILRRGQQVFSLHCTVSGRVLELRGPTLQIGFSEFTEVQGLLLPKNLHLQSRGEELQPLSMIETWTISKWQVNPPRQPHWFQLPTGD